jgi:glycosyltransferase involved in cell wall biosynthesis
MAFPPAQVLITHPGRQHSHQAALGLAAAGSLAGYWAGVPSLREHAARVPRRFWSGYSTVPLPSDVVRMAPWVPAVRRLGRRLPRAAACRIDLWACRLFDRWAATRLDDVRARAVVACEISALDTFEVAKRRGWVTLLDAPSFHHRTQDRVQDIAEPPGVHARINSIKDRELALTDHVLTVSELARESYVEAGIPAARVHALPLGADLELFTPKSEHDRAAGDEVVFLFAGATIQRKGFDLVAAAFRAVAASAPWARLRVVGPRGDAAGSLQPDDPCVTLVGALDQAGLAAELRRADCLVLPSRHDSYGMVVAEALASGTPAIVSTMVGAKDLVEEDATGWVVPTGDLGALTARLSWCAGHRTALRAMADRCRRRAETATWGAYHRRLTDLLDRLLSAPAAMSVTGRPAA